VTSHVFEVAAAFRTPEINLLKHDVIIWSADGVIVVQKRNGKLREMDLPHYFAAHLLAQEDRIFCREVIRRTPAISLAVGDESTPRPRLRRLSAPRHLVALT